MFKELKEITIIEVSFRDCLTNNSNCYNNLVIKFFDELITSCNDFIN